MQAIISAEEDFFNSYKTRNSDNTDLDDYNCGGYALNTYSWYLPYPDETEDQEQRIACLVDDNYSKEEIYEILLEDYTVEMLRDFPEKLRVLSSPTEVKDNERLIYFRLFYELIGEDENGYYDDVHFDFHYRYFEDGDWIEKMGGESLRICNDDMEGPWETGVNTYDSRTVYLALEI